MGKRYDVKVGHDGEFGIYFQQTLAEAKRIATIEAKKHPGEVFVEWFRRSDGQKGYLNSDGNHAITGKAW